ncbi:hypothetical protein [Georgenia sp. H159]|uniref:hypothetical protein n=1 Tax=Georgenia sp. H159 TaxID=3076115 RepID=UPI002D79E772|nr:hypothetical protein [Georgenia sp. H159]
MTSRPTTSDSPAEAAPRPGRWARATLVAPSSHGFVLLAADTGTWRLPLALPSRRRRALVDQLRTTARVLRRDDRVRRADVFTALVRPPGGPGRSRAGGSPARYDVVMLVETTSPVEAEHLTDGSAMAVLTRLLRSQGHGVLSFAGSNARRIAPVDHERPGVFLFNYFSAPDVATNLAVWEHTAGWFERETGLDNSTVLEPLTDVPYAVVNHCRWDRVRDVMPSLVLKPSFRGFVLRAFADRDVVPEPLLYRQVGEER